MAARTQPGGTPGGLSIVRGPADDRVVTQPDVTLQCHLCGESFVFSAGEQELQRLRGIDHQPTRCSACRRRPPTVPFLPAVRRPA